MFRNIVSKIVVGALIAVPLVSLNATSASAVVSGVTVQYKAGSLVATINCTTISPTADDDTLEIPVASSISTSVKLGSGCSTTVEFDQATAISDYNSVNGGQISISGVVKTPANSPVAIGNRGVFSFGSSEATCVKVNSNPSGRTLRICTKQKDLGTDPAGTMVKETLLTIPVKNSSEFNIPMSGSSLGPHQLGNNSDCVIEEGHHVFAKKVLTITKPGDFTFRVVNSTSLKTEIGNWTKAGAISDPFMAVYSTFDAANPDTNILGCNDDVSSYSNGLEVNSGKATSTGYVVGGRMSWFNAQLQPGTYTILLATFGNMPSSSWITDLGGIGGEQSATFELWGPAGSIELPGEKTEAPKTCTKKFLGNVKFKADSAKLSKAAKKKLNAYAKSIKVSGCKKITLNGYASTTSDYSKIYKRDRVGISKERNNAVATYLASQFKKIGAKVTIKKVNVAGKNPVASNKNEKGRAKNRRVEIVLTP